MAEVPDHLVPTDGLTRSAIRFVGIEFDRETLAPTVRFEIVYGDGMRAGTFNIQPDSKRGDSMEAMVAEAHRDLRNILRQWLYETDVYTRAYEGFGRSPAT